MKMAPKTPQITNEELYQQLVRQLLSPESTAVENGIKRYNSQRPPPLTSKPVEPFTPFELVLYRSLSEQIQLLNVLQLKHNLPIRPYVPPAANDPVEVKFDKLLTYLEDTMTEIEEQLGVPPVDFGVGKR